MCSEVQLYCHAPLGRPASWRAQHLNLTRSVSSLEKEVAEEGGGVLQTQDKGTNEVMKYVPGMKRETQREFSEESMGFGIN